MTLKEILDSCDFKDIAPIIVEKGAEWAKSLHVLKQIYDGCRYIDTDAIYENQTEAISICKCFDDELQEYYITTSCDDLFGKLTSEIVVKEGFLLTNEEIAAYWLWEFIYHDLIIDFDGYYFDKEIGITDSSNLNRMAKVEHSICRLTVNSKSFKRDELKYLFDTKWIFYDTYQSRSYDISKRIDYLIDLFENYETFDFSQFTHFLLMFRTSSEYPLNEAETEALQNFFKEYFPKSANLKFGYGIEENLGTEISLMFLGSY